MNGDVCITDGQREPSRSRVIRIAILSQRRFRKCSATENGKLLTTAKLEEYQLAWDVARHGCRAGESLGLRNNNDPGVNSHEL